MHTYYYIDNLLKNINSASDIIVNSSNEYEEIDSGYCTNFVNTESGTCLLFAAALTDNDNPAIIISKAKSFFLKKYILDISRIYFINIFLNLWLSI